MDLTPDLNQTTSQDSAIASSFDCSEVFGSTPKSHEIHNQKKRKHSNTTLLDSPQFSSTLNESLVHNFRECRLETFIAHTPEKQKKIHPLTSSPLIEKQEILYGNNYIKPNLPKIIPSPFNKLTIDKSLMQMHKTFIRHQSLKFVLSNPVIMSNIFKRLSNGDLYRVSMVSKAFRQALLNDNKAKRRFFLFKDGHKSNKENYVITPPSSPESNKCDSPPGPSNASTSFREFTKMARLLPNSNQSLNKCPKCGRVAIVQHNIGQCQNRNCGLISCLLCGSSSSILETFVDKCKNSSLLDTALGDRSNYNNENYYYSSNSISYDSGIYSENETTPKVKRELFSTSTASKTVFGNNNINRVQLTTHSVRKKEVKYNFVPVKINRRTEDGEWSSPERDIPKIGSKQSKRNLKRLTR